MLKRIPLPALPLLGVLLLLGIYWIYWSELADRLKDGAARWATEQAQSGIEVTWDELHATGFPLRIELDFRNARYAAVGADAPWSWSTPRLAATMMPYSFDKVIVHAASPMVLTRWNGQQEEIWEIESEKAAASYTMNGQQAERISIDLQTASAARLDAPGNAAADRLQLHARRTPDMDGSVDLAASAQNMTFSNGLLGGLTDLLGPDIAHIGVQSRITAAAGDRVFDDIALARLEGGSIAVSEGAIAWGDVETSISGSTDISPAGLATGRFDTRLKGHNEVVDAMVRQGMVDANTGNTLKTTFALLAMTTGGGQNELRVPLILKANDVYLGPVKVGRLD